MSRAWKTALLVTPLVLLLGCAARSDGPVGPAPGNTVVTGSVTEIRDLVPVDGGATITVATKNGGTEHLLFPSLHTSPPPTPQTIALYDLVRRVEVGDRIRAEGQRTDSGVKLESLEILEGQP